MQPVSLKKICLSSNENIEYSSFAVLWNRNGLPTSLMCFTPKYGLNHFILTYSK